MGQILGPDNIPTLTTPTSTTVTLAAANAGQSTTITVGGQQYTLSSTLTLTTTASVGAGALDTGTIASATTYYVYVIVNSSSFTPALIGSLNAPSSGPTIPTGYLSAYKLVGGFITSASSTSISSASGASANIPGTLPVVAGAIDSTGHWNIGQTNTFVTALNVNGILQITGFGGSGSGGGAELYLSSANAGGTGTPSDWRIVSVTQSNNAFTGAGANVGDLCIRDQTSGTLTAIIRGPGTTGGNWLFGNGTGSLTQTTSTISTRATNSANFGNSVEWGHPNQSGYASVLGYNTGGGTPFIGFSCESDANNPNRFTTRGQAGVVITGGVSNGPGFYIVPNANASNQSGTFIGGSDINGSWTLGPTTATQQHNINGTLFVQPANTSGIQVGITLNDTGSGAGEGLSIDWSSASRGIMARLYGDGTATGGSLVAITNSTTSGSPNTTAGVVLSNGSTSWAAISDISQKKNVLNLSYGLNEINQLRAIRYDYITDAYDNSSRLGFIAQEVYPIIPEAVRTDDTRPWSLSLTDFVPALVRAIQDLKAENDTLKARLDGYGIP